MARIVVQYPLQDLGMHQRAIEERRGHGYDGGNKEVNSKELPRLSLAIYANRD